MTTENELRERVYEHAAHYAYYHDNEHGKWAATLADVWASIAREVQNGMPTQTLLLSVGWVDWLPRLENDYAC